MSKLSARVKAVNNVNAAACSIFPLIAAALMPFIGKKVLKVDGSLVEKVKNQIAPLLPSTPSLSSFRNHLNNSLSWTIKTSETIDGIAMYAEAAIYVGEVEDGILKSIYTDSPFATGNVKTDYTVEDIMAKREACRLAKEAAREAEAALGPFGEYDR